MILNYPNGNPFKFFFLSKGMADTLLSQSIPLQDLSKLSLYHGKLTYGEMADILKYQTAPVKVLGLPVALPFLGLPNDYNTGMLSAAFNASDSEALAGQFKNATRFQYVTIGQTIIMVAGEHGDKVLPGWVLTEAHTFSGALLETIYTQVGYLDCHSGPVVHPALGEFTLAEVFKLLSIENP